MKKLILLISIIFILSCNKTQNIENIENDTNKNVKYAQKFNIEYIGKIKKITVYNPWQGSTNTKYEYYLLPRSQKIPDSLKNKNVIFIPIKKIVCLSTTYLAAIDTLNMLSSVCGVADAQYVYADSIRKLIAAQKIKGVEVAGEINYEKLISLQPEIIMLYGINEEVKSKITKLKELGLMPVINADYLENSPLGRAEWIKFVAAFYDKDNLSNKIFENVEKNYLKIKNNGKTAGYKPKVILNAPYNGVWYLPGGDSYMARLIADAGGDYIRKKHKGTASFAISFESMYTEGLNADIWINIGMFDNKEQLSQTDERIKDFKPFKTSMLYNNNKRSRQNGSNDFFESGALFPDKILSDLFNIFSLDTNSQQKFYYYQKLK